MYFVSKKTLLALFEIREVYILNAKNIASEICLQVLHNSHPYNYLCILFHFYTLYFIDFFVPCKRLKFLIFQLAKCAPELSNMARVFLVDVDKVPVYTKYFDITLIPSTIFFFNAQHIKVDWGWELLLLLRRVERGKQSVFTKLDRADRIRYSYIWKPQML